MPDVVVRMRPWQQAAVFAAEAAVIGGFCFGVRGWGFLLIIPVIAWDLARHGPRAVLGAHHLELRRWTESRRIRWDEIAELRVRGTGPFTYLHVTPRPEVGFVVGDLANRPYRDARPVRLLVGLTSPDAATLRIELDRRWHEPL